MSQHPAPARDSDWEDVDEWEDIPSALPRGQVVSPIPPPPSHRISRELPPDIVTRAGSPDSFGNRVALVSMIKIGDMLKGAWEANRDKPGGMAQAAVEGIYDTIKSDAPLREKVATGMGMDVQAIKESSERENAIVTPENVVEGVFAWLSLVGGSRIAGERAPKLGLERRSTTQTIRRITPAERAVERLSAATGSREVAPAMRTALKDVADTVRAAAKSPETLGEFHEAVRATSRRLDDQFKSFLDEPAGPMTSVGDTLVTGKDIAQAIRKRATTAVKKADPQLWQALQEEAVVFDQAYTLSELNELRMMKNADAASYYAKGTIERAADMKKAQAGKVATIVAADELRNLLYDELPRRSQGAKKIGTDGIRNLKLREQALLEVATSLDDRIAVLAGAVPFEHGMPWYQRMSSGSAYVNPVHPLSGAGVHVGQLADVVAPRAARESFGANRAVRQTFERKPTVAARVKGAAAGGAAAAAVTAMQPISEQGILTPPDAPAKRTAATKELERLGVAARGDRATLEREVGTFINSPRYRDWDDEDRKRELQQLVNRITKRRPRP